MALKDVNSLLFEVKKDEIMRRFDGSDFNFDSKNKKLDR
jgi:hypothetical protein